MNIKLQVSDEKDGSKKKKVIKLKPADREMAKTHVRSFFKDYPNVIKVDGKEIPVSEYHIVYAVMLLLDESNELTVYFPKLDFKDVLKLAPADAIGIRIYEAIRPKKQGDFIDHKFLNYLTFTVIDKANSSNDLIKHPPASDHPNKKVYQIKNHKFELREFRGSRIKPHVEGKASHHLTCAPDCGQGTLLTD